MVTRNNCGTGTAEGKSRASASGAENRSRKSAPEKQSLADSRNRGRPTFQNRSLPKTRKSRRPEVKWKRWVILSAALGLLGFAAIEIPRWLQPHAQSEFVLTAADIDQVATAHAREALRAGQIPPELAEYPKANFAANCRRSGIALHQTPVASGSDRDARAGHRFRRGAVLGEDILTPEHPIGRSFPAGKDTPTQFHFTVEEPGPSHQVTCWVDRQIRERFIPKRWARGKATICRPEHNEDLDSFRIAHHRLGDGDDH